MANYHGDMMYEVGTVYDRPDERNYAVAIILLVLFGAMGIHRLYLNDRTIGFGYFAGFTATLLPGLVTFEFTPFIIYMALASAALLIEFCYFVYKWIARQR